MNTVEMITDDNGNVLESNLLIKVTKRNYAEDIQAGRLYMKSLRYFRELEQQGVGDEEEGLINTAPKGEIFWNGQKIGDVRNIRTYYDCPVFCTATVSLKKQKNGSIKYTIPLKLLREFMVDKTADYVLMIINRNEFQKRIDEKMREKKIQGFFGNVNYTDEKAHFSHEERYKAAFRKRMEFAHQHECRLALNLAIEDFYVLEIGDISDITTFIPIFDNEHEMAIEVQYN